MASSLTANNDRDTARPAAGPAARPAAGPAAYLGPSAYLGHSSSSESSSSEDEEAWLQEGTVSVGGHHYMIMTAGRRGRVSLAARGYRTRVGGSSSYDYGGMKAR